MALFKNKGPLLTSEYYGNIELIPPEFRSKVGLRKFDQEVPVDILPDLLIDPLVQSQVVQTRTDERLKTNYEFIGDLDTVLSDEVFIKETCQIGHHTRQLVPEGTNLVTGCLTESATQKNLGNGLLDQNVITVDSLFGNVVSQVSIPDIIPDIFKALLPVFEHAETECGIIDDPPTLGIGEFVHREEQISGCRKRISTQGRAGITYPQSVVLLRHTTEEYGGEITKIEGFLDDSEPLVEEGLGVISSEVRNLGAGTWFRSTEKWNTAEEWPALNGTEVDPRTGIVIDIGKQVVDAGTAGGVFGDFYIDVKPIDKWRSLAISSRLNLASLPAPRTWETTVEYSFPDTLLSAAWLWAQASGTLSYAFDMVLMLDIKEGYRGPCRAKVTESFSNGPPLDVITPTIFSPQGYTVGYAWAFAADLVNECDACVDHTEAHASYQPIPPTLHDAVTIGGGVSLIGGTFRNTLPATTPIAIPPAGTLIVKACDVEVWRFGVFYRRLMEIYVPTF